MEMSRASRAILLAPAFFLGVMMLGGFVPIKRAEVRIVGTDYAYIDVPVSVRHGFTYFAFKNAGKVRHEMSLLRLEPGVTPAAAMENLKAGGKGRAAFIKTVGILIEPPGGSSIGWLAIDLRRGETYMMICSLRDKPDAEQHYQMGMYSAFAVR